MTSEDRHSQYQKELEGIIASLIQKFKWLDNKSEEYKNNMAVYTKLIDAQTKVTAHLRDFFRMAGVRIESDQDLALLLARIKREMDEKETPTST